MTKFDKWFNNLALAHPVAVASAAVIIEGGALLLLLPREYWGLWFLLPCVSTWLILVWVLNLARKQHDDGRGNNRGQP